MNTQPSIGQKVRAARFLRCVYGVVFSGMVGAAGLFGGCRSAETHRRQADEAAQARIGEQRRVAGVTGGVFRVERPSDLLRQRLIERQNLPILSRVQPPAAATGSVWKLTLVDALKVGASNSRDYQDAKETVFAAALKLDTESEGFRTTLEGVLSGAYTDAPGDGTRGVAGSAGVGVGRTLESGAVLASRLSVDLVKLLTLDRQSAFGILWDASITAPLLRGAGREIAREPLTQAERNLVYALWGFERFKRSFAVSVADTYLKVLQQKRQWKNNEDTLGSLVAVTRRARELARAGRLPEIRVSQAERDELRARDRVNQARKIYEEASDRMKLDLGLPVDARVDLDESVLDGLSVPAKASDGDGATAELLARALSKRLDLAIAAGQVADAERSVRIAADSLRGGLQLKAKGVVGEGRTPGSADAGNARLDFGKGDYGATLESDLPWRRTPERNAYRRQLIDLEKARRQLEQKEDVVKFDVRNLARKLAQAGESYAIQLKSLDLARRRVENVRLQLDAGRAEMRDILEAEEALLEARNGVVAAVIAYRSARWAMLRDTEQLAVTEEGFSHDIITQ